MPTDAHVPLLRPVIMTTTWAGERKEIPLDHSSTPATTFSAALNLSACALGASMLSLPFAMTLAGPAITLLLVVIFAGLALLSAQAVVTAGRSCRRSSFVAIVSYYLGPACARLVDCLIALALLVAALSYIVGLADLLPEILPFMQQISRPQLIIATVVILYPVTLVGSLAAFGPASFFATAGCYILVVALLVDLIKLEGTWQVPSWETCMSVSFPNVIYILPIICFVYAFHYVLTDTISELPEPTLRVITSVNVLTTTILVVCYIAVSVAGYLLVNGRRVSSNILNDIAAQSTAAQVAKWAITILLFVTYSLFLIPLRRKLEVMCFNRLSTAYFAAQRLCLAAALNICILLAAIALPDLGLANTLAGGCISLIMFFFPGLLLVYLEKSESQFRRVSWPRLALGFFFILLGAVICFVGLFGSFIFDV